MPLENLAVSDGLWFLDDRGREVNQKVVGIRITCISLKILHFPLDTALASYTLRVLFHLIYFEWH